MDTKSKTFEEWLKATDEKGELDGYDEHGLMCESYLAGQDSMKPVIEGKHKIKTCGTCRFWDFKVSTEKCWGRCRNEKVLNSIHLRIELPESIMLITSDRLSKPNDYADLLNEMRENIEIRFEEDSFGCIYHEAREKQDE